MKYMFKVPDGWDLKKCFVKIDHDKNIIIDNPIDHNIFSRATVKLEPVLTDDIDIQEVIIALDRLVQHHPNQTLTFLTSHSSQTVQLKDLLIYGNSDEGIILNV